MKYAFQNFMYKFTKTEVQKHVTEVNIFLKNKQKLVTSTIVVKETDESIQDRITLEMKRLNADIINVETLWCDKIITTHGYEQIYDYEIPSGYRVHYLIKN